MSQPDDDGCGCAPAGRAPKADVSRGAEQPRTIRLFDEASGAEIGRISEAELAVLRDALEEEGPDDTDYWINLDEVEMIASRPGATEHLVRLLRAAVGNNPDGVDVAFEREGQARQSLREAGPRSAAERRRP